MTTFEIKCWVTRDGSDYPDYFGPERPLQDERGFYVWEEDGPDTAVLHMPGLGERRGCWPAKLVVEVGDGD